MSNRLMLLISALLLVTVLVAACSSNDEAIERAVQQTVEAQRAVDTAVALTAEAQKIDPATTVPTELPHVDNLKEDEPTGTPLVMVVSTPTEQPAKPTLAETVIGVWSGNGTIYWDDTRRSWTRDFTITFFNDILIVAPNDPDDPGRSFEYDGYYYEVVDENTLDLKEASDGDVVANMRITVDDSGSLGMIFESIGGSHDGRTVEIETLQKVENVTMSRTGSIKDTVIGTWTRADGVTIHISPNGYIAAQKDAVGELPRFMSFYAFDEQDQMFLKLPVSLSAFERWPVITVMPNDNTLIQWVDDPNTDGFDYFWYAKRVLSPQEQAAETVQVAEDEVIFPYYEPVKNGDESICGYIDRSGRTVVAPQYFSCAPFFEGLAVVELFDGIYGYIDNTGSFVFPLGYGRSHGFSNGLAITYGPDDTGEGAYGYIDRSGDYVIRPQYRMATQFSDGIAIAETKDGRVVAIDTLGNEAFEFNDPDILNVTPLPTFHEGLFGVRNGYVDKQGTLVIPISGGPFSEGLAATGNRDGTGCYYIDPKGHIALQTEYYLCERFTEGLAHVYRYGDYLCGYIDESGKVVVDFRFDECREFSDGRAVVQVGDYFGVIDTQGYYVVEPYAFSSIQDFQNGLAQVEIDGKKGYIDRDGNYVLKP